MRKFLMSLTILLSVSMLAGAPAVQDDTEEAIIERYDVLKKTEVVRTFKDSLLISDASYMYDDIERILSKTEFGSLDVQYEIIKTARELNISPEWLILVIYKESRGVTTITNSKSGAMGIIQWLPSTAKCLGYNVDTIKKMTFTEQLVLVKLYLIKTGKLDRVSSYEDLYLCVFYPRAVGKHNNYVIGRRNSRVTKMNRSVDVNKDGIITVRDFKSYANVI